MAATKSNTSTHGYANTLANWYASAPEIARRNVAAFSAAGKLYTELLQEVAKRHQDMTQHNLAHASNALKDIMNTGNPSQRIAKQLELTKRSFEIMVSNTGQVAELVNRSHREAADILTRRAAELIDETKAHIEKSQAA